MSTAELHAVPDEPPGEDLVDEVDEEAEGERRRAFAVPDLSPYTDVMWIPEVINAGAAAVRRAPGAAWRAARQRKERRAAEAAATPAAPGERSERGRALLRLAVDVVAGMLLLGRAVLMWVGGNWGPDSVAPPARLGIAGFGLYCLYRADEAAPAGTTVVLGSALLLGSLRVRGRGVKKPATPPLAAPAAVPVSAKGGKRRLPGLLRKRPAPAEQAPVEALQQPPVGDVVQAPAEPPLTALIRAAIGDDNGVHLEDLRPLLRAHIPGLAQASDKQLREVLIEAGFDPTRKFRARGRAGRAGVRRADLPPWPSPGEASGDSPAPPPHPGDRSRPAKVSAPESGGERSGEQPERDFEVIDDPERGPTYARVVHHEGKADH